MARRLSRMLGGCHERSLAHSPRCGRRAAGCGACRRRAQDRRAAGQSRHAGRGRCGLGAPLSQGIPVRPAGDREPGPALEPDPQRHHPAGAAAAQGARLPTRSGTASATNRRSRPSRARRPKSSAARSSPRAARRGRLGDALRQSVDRVAAARHGGAGLRAHPAHAALSAILRGDHRDRRATRSFACSCACASSRRCGLRRRTTTTRSISRRWRPRSAPSWHSSTFKPEVILASFHGIPQEYVAKGDPYYAHCLETMRLLRERLKLDDSETAADLPVALRPRRMAPALRPTRP